MRSVTLHVQQKSMPITTGMLFVWEPRALDHADRADIGPIAGPLRPTQKVPFFFKQWGGSPKASRSTIEISESALQSA